MAAVHGHAAACADCRAELLAAEAALAALDPALPLPADAPTLPEPDLGFLRPGAEPSSDRPTPARRRAVWAWAAAALLLGLVLLRAGGPWRSGETTVPGAGGAGAVAGTPGARPGASPERTAGRGDLAAARAGSSAAASASGRPTSTTLPAGLPTVPAAAVGRRPTLVAPRPTPTAGQAPEPTLAAALPVEPQEPEEPDPTATPTVLPPPVPEQALCALQGFGPDAGLFDPACGPFRSAAAFDLYRIHVSIGGAWRFDTCENSGGLDTVLALYPDGGFDPLAPCRKLLAAADDGCGPQAVLAVELAPGDYVLLISEQTGDLSAPYRLGVSGPAGQDVCPRVLPFERPPMSPAPSATAPAPTALGPTPAAATPAPGTPGFATPVIETPEVATPAIATQPILATSVSLLP